MYCGFLSRNISAACEEKRHAERVDYVWIWQYIGLFLPFHATCILPTHHNPHFFWKVAVIGWGFVRQSTPALWRAWCVSNCSATAAETATEDRGIGGCRQLLTEDFRIDIFTDLSILKQPPESLFLRIISSSGHLEGVSWRFSDVYIETTNMLRTRCRGVTIKTFGRYKDPHVTYIDLFMALYVWLWLQITDWLIIHGWSTLSGSTFYALTEKSKA